MHILFSLCVVEYRFQINVEVLQKKIKNTKKDKKYNNTLDYQYDIWYPILGLNERVLIF